MKIQGTIADPISTSGIIYSSAKKYSMHVSSTTHLSFKGHFNNQDVPKKGKSPGIPRKAWPFYISPCWQALKQCLPKLLSESSKLQCHVHTSTFLNE